MTPSTHFFTLSGWSNYVSGWNNCLFDLHSDSFQVPKKPN